MVLILCLSFQVAQSPEIQKKSDEVVSGGSAPMLHCAPPGGPTAARARTVRCSSTHWHNVTSSDNSLSPRTSRLCHRRAPFSEPREPIQFRQSNRASEH